MHILHDPAVRDLNNPCGFCLNVGNLCSIQITKGKGKKGAFTVDPQQSRCTNAAKLSITSASKSTTHNPCTNVPLACPLCRQDADPVWKYNLRSHILMVHPSADIEQFKHLYDLDPHKQASMKELFKAKPRRSKLKIASGIKISGAHSSQRALRRVFPSVTCIPFLTSLFTLPGLPPTVLIVKITLLNLHQPWQLLDLPVMNILAQCPQLHRQLDPLLPYSLTMLATMLKKLKRSTKRKSTSRTICQASLPIGLRTGIPQVGFSHTAPVPVYTVTRGG